MNLTEKQVIHMKRTPKRTIVVFIIVFSLFFSLFNFAAPQMRVNEIDLSQYAADDVYVYYHLPEMESSADTLVIRKKLNTETAQQYRSLLRQIEHVQLLSEKEKARAAQNFDGSYIAFSEKPQTLILNSQYYQFWHWGRINLCISENYEEIYRQMQELTMKYLADDYEIVQYQRTEEV